MDVIDYYEKNPLVHRDRRLALEDSEWVQSFACEDMTILIVCRGPIRQEALDTFAEMGVSKVGILLSEKDSIVYPRALSPELRRLDPSQVHAVPDYSGATKEEREERVQQIFRIAKTNGYDYIFAGYGFMAEDGDFVEAIEKAGLKFIGPGSRTQRAAGLKDEAKRTALQENVHVTPGVNDATARTLLKKYPDRAALKKLATSHGWKVSALDDDSISLQEAADAVLDASYSAGVDLYSIDELCAQVQEEVADILKSHKGSRVRLKAIGGGGGKGQRIVQKATEAPAMVREILSEVKATGVGDNKNILLELNVESTRHNEIQLIGNGEWCVALGGRDCSLQMHEQKLLEVSMTQEALSEAIEREQEVGNKKKVKALIQERKSLKEMEEEAERFGLAVGLDSVSTFESIVSGDQHFFMEVNTRIQVEHRVTELCYALRFRNPADPQDYFDVHSLVEAMALLAKHKSRLPRPEQVRREGAAVEARLNATDRSLSPAAGGEIIFWSDPIEGEVRDDQGICYKNPDTGLFMRYKLAGAYDSNIALLVTTGDDRKASFERLLEVLRRTILRGPDLQTNLTFHYGLVSWFLANGVDAQPTTGFVVPYLTLVGQLRNEANEIDLNYAYDRICSQYLTEAGADEAAQKATRETVQLKRTLIQRPTLMLLEEPHLLSAWLSKHRADFEVNRRRVSWNRNPLHVLADTYRLLHMDDLNGSPAAHRIWEHDQELLERALAFYNRLDELAGDMPWTKLDTLLRDEKPAFGLKQDAWQKVRSSHLGFQMGLELLALVPLIGDKVQFYDLRVNDDLTVTIPERLFDKDLQARMKKILVPPPATRADEIVAVTGGMFYAQEGPGLPPFVKEGQHFEAGDALYILEVMKMFNKVYAPFAGTIDKVLVDTDGTIVSKGQPLFKVTPDERIIDEDPAEVQARIEKNTEAYVVLVA